jgi:hypothetical protein
MHWEYPSGRPSSPTAQLVRQPVDNQILKAPLANAFGRGRRSRSCSASRIEQDPRDVAGACRRRSVRLQLVRPKARTARSAR